MSLTLILGLAYVNSTAYLFTQMNLAVRESSAAVLIYCITGAHVAMTIAAMVFALVMVFRTLGGQYSGRDREGDL